MSYTEEEFRAAVDKAVAEATTPLNQRISELEGAQAESAVEAKFAEIRAEAEAKVSEIQSQLDSAVLEAQQAKEAREQLEAFLNEEAEKAQREAETAARKEERLGKVREAANFPEEYLEANADRFAAMSDEDFDKAIEDWGEIAAKSDDGSRPPAATALHASRDNDPGRPTSAVAEVFALRDSGVDTRTL